jgi:hypothetical protein
MVDIWPVLNEIHREMLPVHEDWVGGMKLQPTNIYGIRVNRNGSALALHYDKVSVQRCAVLCCKLRGLLVSAWRGAGRGLRGFLGLRSSLCVVALASLLTADPSQFACLSLHSVTVGELCTLSGAHPRDLVHHPHRPRVLR